MNNIDNTASPENLSLNALGALAVGTTDWITAQEAAGQRQVVASASLPTDSGGTDAEFLALGFTFGDPSPRDPMFRPATLPEGWSKQGSDHSMWSYVVDSLGRRRVAIFYKAAFYDRSAHMRLETITGYARGLAYDGGLPAYDDTWCTPESFAETVAALRAELIRRSDEAAELAAGRGGDYWPGRVAELKEELANHDAWATKVAAAVTR
jgi:hypothetical protein